MSEPQSKWEATVGELRDRASKMHEAREAGLSLCRKLIQASAKCIRHIHRHQFAEAEALLNEAIQIAKSAQGALKPYGELYYAGYLHDAEKEMVEAAAMFSIVKEGPLPHPDKLGVQIMSFLNGMGEAASEARRFALDEMRAGRLSEAERILAQMESIYDELITFDFADSMTGGLRRTCDALRAVIERTRSDITMTASQRALIDAIESAKGKSS